MKFEFLTKRLDAIPTVARWYNEEWGRRLHDETEEASVKKLRPYLNDDKIPFILLAIEHGEIIGAAQLKYREMADLYPEKEHWLGAVFVAPAHRGQGIGSKLAQQIAAIAPSYGVRTLYLQTERLDGGIYTRLGWQPVEQADNHGIRVLVMERHVGA